MPRQHRELGLKGSTSNLCSEITLPTGRDHLGNDRTAVCCLSSLNLETWDQWNGDKQFIEDVMRFLDNVLQDLSTAPRRRWPAPNIAPAANARSALASWVSTASCRRAALALKARWRSHGTSRYSSTSTRR